MIGKSHGVVRTGWNDDFVYPKVPAPPLNSVQASFPQDHGLHHFGNSSIFRTPVDSSGERSAIPAVLTVTYTCGVFLPSCCLAWICAN